MAALVGCSDIPWSRLYRLSRWLLLVLPLQPNLQLTYVYNLFSLFIFCFGSLVVQAESDILSGEAVCWYTSPHWVFELVVNFHRIQLVGVVY